LVVCSKLFMSHSGDVRLMAQSDASHIQRCTKFSGHRRAQNNSTPGHSLLLFLG
jgi:hypothetical protein